MKNDNKILPTKQNSQGCNKDIIISNAHHQKPIKIFTIGFTQKSAPAFFELLKDSGVKKLIDTRLNNVSQLAGFTKKDDLAYFLKEIVAIDYNHRIELSPTKEILKGYKNKQITWEDYERQFNKLLQERQIEKTLSPSELNGACLLCSEPTHHNCHRRLVAEYLQKKWGNVTVEHL